MKIYYEKYGCALNQAETMHIVQGFIDSGYEITEKPEEADKIIIGTCVVIKHTENQMLRRIEELEKLGKDLIVYGCLPGAREDILNKFNVTKIKARDFDGKININGLSIYTENIPLIENTVTIPIAQGCTGHCTYCISKLSRGNLKSYDEELILEKVRNAVKKGFREIRLSALDTASYGMDKGKTLADLLEKITNLEGDFRIRVGMMEPKNTLRIIDDLLEVYKNEKIFKFFHIPVQSGDDRILEVMGREYGSEDFIKIYDKIKNVFKHFTLSTDIIVGFPGEDDTAFENTIKIIEKARPDILNITRFSPREGTLAYKMKQIPSIIAKERSKMLTDIHYNISLERNRELLGLDFDVIVTEKGKRNFLGRTDGYRPVVLKNGEIGKHYRVKITEAKPFYLYGEILQ